MSLLSKTLGVCTLSIVAFVSLTRAEDATIDLSGKPAISKLDNTVATATPNADGTGVVLRVEYPQNDGRAHFSIPIPPFDGPLTAVSFNIKGDFGFARIGFRTGQETTQVGQNIPKPEGSDSITLDFSKPRADANGETVEIKYPIESVQIGFRFKDTQVDEVEISNLTFHTGDVPK
jgi:hypothetical protein